MCRVTFAVHDALAADPTTGMWQQGKEVRQQVWVMEDPLLLTTHRLGGSWQTPPPSRASHMAALHGESMRLMGKRVALQSYRLRMAAGARDSEQSLPPLVRVLLLMRLPMLRVLLPPLTRSPLSLLGSAGAAAAGPGAADDAAVAAAAVATSAFVAAAMQCLSFYSRLAVWLLNLLHCWCLAGWLLLPTASVLAARFHLRRAPS